MTTEISIIGIFALLLIGCVLGLHCWLGDSQQGLGKNYFRYVISWQGVFALKSLDASPGYQKPLRASQTGKSPDIGYPPGYWEKIRELKAKGFEGQVLMAEMRKIPDFAEYYKRQKMEHENE